MDEEYLESSIVVRDNQSHIQIVNINSNNRITSLKSNNSQVLNNYYYEID